MTSARSPSRLRELTSAPSLQRSRDRRGVGVARGEQKRGVDGQVLVAALRVHAGQGDA